MRDDMVDEMGLRGLQGLYALRDTIFSSSSNAVGQGRSDWADQDCGQGVGRLQHTLQWLGIRLHCHSAYSREGVWGHDAGFVLTPFKFRPTAWAFESCMSHALD